MIVTAFALKNGLEVYPLNTLDRCSAASVRQKGMMHQHMSEKDFLAIPLLLFIVSSMSCAPSGRGYYEGVAEQANRQDQPSPSQVPSENHSAKWWHGPGGEEAIIDIDFDTDGLKIEVFRTYLKRYKINSPIGLGWTHNYLMHFRPLPQQQLKLFDARGSESIFFPSGPGLFTLLSGDIRRLSQDPDGTLKFPQRDGTVLQFNRKGRLTSIIGKNGNTITVAYGEEGYLQSIRDRTGNGLTFHYDPVTHRLNLISDHEGRSASYEHDHVGNLTLVTNAKGLTTKYTYDQRNNIAFVQ